MSPDGKDLSPDGKDLSPDGKDLLPQVQTQKPLLVHNGFRAVRRRSAAACLSGNAAQGQQAFANPMLYDVIATQHGISPNDAHNAAGTYTPPTAAHI
jgi:hypothetical protein